MTNVNQAANTNRQRVTNLNRLLSSTEGVADRKAVARDARGAVIDVVVEEVEVCFGANEEATRWIEFEPGAEVAHEVVAVLVIGADERAIGSRVEARAQGTEAAKKLQVGVAGELGRVNSVDVVKDRTIRDAAIQVVATRAPPRDP